MSEMDEQAPLSIAVVPVTPFAQNCSIVMCNATREAVIDAGGDVPTLMKIREMGAGARVVAHAWACGPRQRRARNW